MNQQKNNRIVIINQDSGYLMIDIANAFADKGFKVHLITGRLVVRNHSLHKSIGVTKIISYQRDSTIKRLGTWVLGFFQILFYVTFKHRNKRLFLVSNPPFNTLLPLFTINPFSLLIYDIYPDTLVEYNVLKETSFLIQKWKKANKKIFKKAQHIYTLNNEMKEVLGNYINRNKIEVIPIWTDNTFLQPILKTDNFFIKELGLQDKFIIQYSGNLGTTHPVEILLDVAEILKDEAYVFVIIGGGEKFKPLEVAIKKRKLKHVVLLPWQPVEKLRQTLAAADIGIVTLGKEASNLSIPSKTYNLMSAGVPILSISENSSALASLVEQYKIGRNFNEGEIIQIVDFIKEIKENNKIKEAYSKNSLDLSKLFSPENAFKFQ